jgi:hypothetical protein
MYAQPFDMVTTVYAAEKLIPHYLLARIFQLVTQKAVVPREQIILAYKGEKRLGLAEAT